VKILLFYLSAKFVSPLSNSNGQLLQNFSTSPISKVIAAAKVSQSMSDKVIVYKWRENRNAVQKWLMILIQRNTE